MLSEAEHEAPAGRYDAALVSVASTTSFINQESEEFSVFIPENAFIAGSNELEVFRAVNSAGGTQTIERLLNLRGNYYSYVNSGTDTVSEISNQRGQSFSLSRELVTGSIDLSSITSGYLEFVGWMISIQPESEMVTYYLEQHLKYKQLYNSLKSFF